VAAAVVAQRGHRLDESALIAACRTELVHYKCPTSVRVVDELPPKKINTRGAAMNRCCVRPTALGISGRLERRGAARGDQRRAHESGYLHTGIARASGDVKVCAVTGHGTIVTPFVNIVARVGDSVMQVPLTGHRSPFVCTPSKNAESSPQQHDWVSGTTGRRQPGSGARSLLGQARDGGSAVDAVFRPHHHPPRRSRRGVAADHRHRVVAHPVGLITGADAPRTPVPRIELVDEPIRSARADRSV
jgi:hypothetical protein